MTERDQKISPVCYNFAMDEFAHMRANIAKILPWVAVSLLLLTYAIFLTHKINLVTADLGRHIKNGEVLWTHPEVLRTNFYSYTETDFPVLNHHWGSGVIFYALYALGGFGFLQIFFILISLATFLLFFYAAKIRAGFSLSALAALPFLTLLAERTEIRPESFSYFFAGAFFVVLTLARARRTRHALWLLPVLQIFWTNLHVYFPLGPALVGAFFIEELFRHGENRRQLFFVLCATSLATLVNPFGWELLFGVATIFSNYAYRLAENQSVMFMTNYLPSENLLIFKLGFLFLVGTFLAVIIRRGWRAVSLADVCVATAMGTLAWLAVRNLTLFAFFATAISAGNLGKICNNPPQSPLSKGGGKRGYEFVTLLATLAIFFVIFASGFYARLPYWRSFGIGLEEGNTAATDFFKSAGLTGPIFNDYDNGGYLIFALYPTERVFVDNRPEAYSTAFFQNRYIPMQEDDTVWKKEDSRYHFNVIFFNRNDMTPWAQRFLVARVSDQREWAPIFLDSYSIIFARRVPQNEKVIEQFEIPHSRFR